MDPHTVPPELKNEGTDWFAIFKQAPPAPGDAPGQKKRTLDVQLVHTLIHERCVCHIALKCMRELSLICMTCPISVVCSVRFSPDGKYLATGCSRTAQIYDTETAQKLWSVGPITDLRSGLN